MQHVFIEHLALAYNEVNPRGDRTIFFIHGHSGSSRTWKYQLADPRLQHYRLVTIDLPGHGQSAPSPNPERDYSPIGTARILSQAVKQLAGDQPYALVGFSYGTNLLAEMLQYDLQPEGLALIGCCCLGAGYGMENVFRPQQGAPVFTYNESNKQVVDHYLQTIIPGSSDAAWLAEDYIATDPQFRTFLFQTAAAGHITDEVQALKAFHKPVCFISGADDQMLFVDYLQQGSCSFWKNTWHTLPHTGHFVHLEAPDRVNDLLLDYVAEALPGVQHTVLTANPIVQQG